jgi:hypothetical protein
MHREGNHAKHKSCMFNKTSGTLILAPSIYRKEYIMSRSMRVTIDGVLDWIRDLLTNLARNSQLHLITAPSLISTLNKSFPVRSVCPRRFLVTASNNDYSSASGLKSSLNGGSNISSQLIDRITTQFIISCKFKDMVRPHRAIIVHIWWFT